MLHTENQRREELVVFIQQRILRFSCLLGALPSAFWHSSHRLHFIWHALPRSTQLPRWQWKLLSGTQWASMQAASAQLSWADCMILHGTMAALPASSIYGTTTNPLGSKAGTVYAAVAQTWYKTSTEGWKVTHQANWKCNSQHLLRVDTILTFLCYKHKANKKLLIISSPAM